MSLEAIDQESERVRKANEERDGKPKFRVTLADLKARVTETEYLYSAHLTIAVLTMDNGYFVVGRAAPVDPTNCDRDYGRKLAYDDAIRQMWPLVAFAHLEDIKENDAKEDGAE